MRRAVKTDHFSLADLDAVASGQRRLGFSGQVYLAAHLSTCGACWETMSGLEPREPRCAANALVRAMRRVTQPRAGLMLPSVHLRLTQEELPRSRFPLLILREALDIGLQDPRTDRLACLKLPGYLATNLWSAGVFPPEVRELRVHVACAGVCLGLIAGDRARAAAALEAAEQAFSEDAGGSANARVEVLLAKFRLACFDHEISHGYLHDALSRVGMDDPVRRFEIASLGVIHLAGAEGLDRDDAVWALGPLIGLRRCRGVTRLSGLFQKARFVARYLSQGGSDLAWAARQSAGVALELEQAGTEVERLGDRYSQGLRHQLMGELRQRSEPSEAAASYEKALRVFAELDLVRAFRTVTQMIHAVPGLTEAELEERLREADKIAAASFAKKAQREISREIARLRSSSAGDALWTPWNLVEFAATASGLLSSRIKEGTEDQN